MSNNSLQRAHIETPVLHAVANPPQLLLVPTAVAGLNIALLVTIWTIFYVTIELNPIFLIVGVILGHGALIMFSIRDQHLETILKAMARYPQNTRNINPARGRVKYTP